MVLQPVGPEPASTYWRRRAVLLGVVLLLLLLLVKACSGGSSPRRTAGPQTTPSPSASPTASPATSPTPTATRPPAATGGTCPDSALKLTVSADQASYPVGGTPTFTMTVTNNATTSCTRDLGPTVVAFEVVSGPARQWSSDDCQPAKGHTPTVLAPGKAFRVSTITWSGKTSRVGCPTPREQAAAGTYQVFGNVGTLTSPRVVFRFR